MDGPKAIGSTWLYRYKSKDWPIVLCDDETAPPAFIQSRHHDLDCPAILLGKHMFVWVRVNDLKPFEPGHDYCKDLPPLDTLDPVYGDNDIVKDEKLRRKALIQDAMHFENHKFWNNYIMSESAARKHEIEMHANKKRSIADHFIMTGGARAKSRQPEKRRRSNDSRQLPTPEATPRKAGKEIMRSIEIEEISDDEEEDEDACLERVRRENVQSVKDQLPPIDHCTIFVGDEYTRFTAKRIAMGKCDLLADLEAYTDELGSHINLYEHVDIQKDRFEPIAEYLRQNDFTPRFAKAITTDRFEDPIFMSEQKDEAAQRIVMIYNTAAKIQFEDVQKLCLRKLALLDTLSSNSLLLVARVAHMTEKYGVEVEEVMMEWLANQMAAQFLKLVESANMTLSRVLKEHVVLSKRVYEKLANDPNVAAGDLDDD